MPLAYKSFGSGTPILFIHGWEINGSYEAAEFEPIFSKLPGYRRIYIDLPGMGDSPADETIVDLQSMYDQVVAFINEHIATERFLLVGSSLGGYLARALATQFGSQILGLHLKVPLINPQNERRDVDVAKPLIENSAAMSLIPAAHLSLLGSVLIQTPAYISTLLAKATNVLAPALRSANSAVLDPIRNDGERYSLAVLESGGEAVFAGPTLFLTGRQDDVVGYRDAVKLLGLYPRATFVALDRGTHFLPIDEGGLVESLVSDWVRRVEEMAGAGLS